MAGESDKCRQRGKHNAQPVNLVRNLAQFLRDREAFNAFSDQDGFMVEMSISSPLRYIPSPSFGTPCGAYTHIFAISLDLCPIYQGVVSCRDIRRSILPALGLDAGYNVVPNERRQPMEEACAG
jgi:hypothetical protein